MHYSDWGLMSHFDRCCNSNNVREQRAVDGAQTQLLQTNKKRRFLNVLQISMETAQRSVSVEWKKASMKRLLFMSVFPLKVNQLVNSHIFWIIMKRNLTVRSNNLHECVSPVQNPSVLFRDNGATPGLQQEPKRCSHQQENAPNVFNISAFTAQIRRKMLF